MHNFISEYSLTILECIGAVIIIALLYFTFFGGAFSDVINNFIKNMIGGI